MAGRGLNETRRPLGSSCVVQVSGEGNTDPGGRSTVGEQAVEFGINSEIKPKRCADELEVRKRGVGNQAEV